MKKTRKNYMHLYIIPVICTYNKDKTNEIIPATEDQSLAFRPVIVSYLVVERIHLKEKRNGRKKI